jgi:hypothetical protein
VMDAQYKRIQDDVELGELENDAFIPHQEATKQSGSTVVTRWKAPRLCNLRENLVRLKVAS